VAAKKRRSSKAIDPGIGNRIRRSREAKGLSQKEVAHAAGIKPPSLSQIEAGQIMPRTETLTRIGDAIGESVSFLLGGRLVGKRESYEGLVGRLFDKVGMDRLLYLDSLSGPTARAMIDNHELGVVRQRRKTAGRRGRRRTTDAPGR